ncbi:MAG: phosphotransferase [Gammaproteobacteria bacterium]|nr:phosphotransferase [Gammaproteobacteria bacterium]
MHGTHSVDPDLITSHTTAAPASIARWVTQHHGIPVQACHLIRRGLNDNYALRSKDGTRYVARLYSIRPRGDFNVDFEVSLLSHLDRRGVDVAAPVPTAKGQSHARLQFPEGLDEIELTGRTLARIHQAARDHDGPPSRYTLDSHHLVGRTLSYLADYPDLDPALLQSYRELAQRVTRELAAAEGRLTRVICHGDTHGFNNHVSTDAAGTKTTTFFDFDDAGPGFLAYDLSVLPWSYLFRKNLKEPDDTLRERWAHYLRGYRSGGGDVGQHDLAALPLFIQLRHLWNLGEAAGRLHHWGTNSAPVDWLKKQLEMFEAWRRVELGA